MVVTLSSVTDTAGDGTTTSRFFHDISIVDVYSRGQRTATRVQEYNSYAAALQEDVQAQATAQGWTTPSGLTLGWSTTTGKYTVAYSVANFTMTFSLLAGRNLLGFSSAAHSGAQTYTSEQVANYAISPTLTAPSDDSTDYEPGGVASLAVADDGVGFGIARYTSPLYRDWVQQYETKAKTMRLSAATTHPWTFQHLFEHCRTVYPFMVYDGFAMDSGTQDADIFQLREDGVAFKPERASPGNDTQFHIPFRALVVADNRGTPTVPGGE